MSLTQAERDGLNVALNEATLVGADLDVGRRRFVATLAVLELPPGAEPPNPDPRIQLQLDAVGRVAASRRRANWDDQRAAAVPFSVEELPQVVADFGQLPIYGWEFIDAGDAAFADSIARLSLDVELGPERDHTLDLFQDAGNDFLAMRVWFRNITIRRLGRGRLIEVPVPEIIAAGRRWWDGLYAGDPRTESAGIVPLKR